MDYIMSLILQSSGGGQITVQEPATASNFTQTLPAATGTIQVSGNMPAFSVSVNASTTLSNATSTKILFQVEEFDTNNNFASSRFTPTVAGYYQINALSSWSPGASSSNWIAIWKNGLEYQRGPRILTSSYLSSSVNNIVFLNGSTDYVEIYGFTNGGSVTTPGSGPDSYFNGAMVRAA
jgi:hypothetical protein